MLNKLLNQWLDENGRGSASRLAEASGLSKSYISELRSGKCGESPTLATALALEKGTGISAKIWLGLDPIPSPRRRKTDRAGAA